MANEILHYRSILSYNAEVFLIQQGDLVKTFMAIDNNFDAVLQPLGTKHDPNGHSHVSLLPFVFLLQRQARAAFELFSRAQSYQGWLLMRPGIESALILGKWVDDPNNATVWNNRVADRQAYRNTYEGKALRSKSLPKSDRIQPVLAKINDNFVHPNTDYYQRHLQTRDVSQSRVAIQVDYVEDGLIQKTHVLAFLHLLLLIQEDLAALLSNLYRESVILPTTMDTFVEKFMPQTTQLVKSNPEAKSILKTFGSWEPSA